MNIKQNASLVARQEAFINAPPEKVWALQADIERWPEWQPDITSAKLEGDMAVGTVFRWKGGGLNIVSTLQEVELGRRIAWTGKSLGMEAAHRWIFEPQAGGTRVITEESLSGWLARLLKLFSPGFLEKSMAQSLQILKVQAEKT